MPPISDGESRGEKKRDRVHYLQIPGQQAEKQPYCQCSLRKRPNLGFYECYFQMKVIKVISVMRLFTLDKKKKTKTERKR